MSHHFSRRARKRTWETTDWEGQPESLGRLRSESLWKAVLSTGRPRWWLGTISMALSKANHAWPRWFLDLAGNGRDARLSTKSPQHPCRRIGKIWIEWWTTRWAENWQNHLIQVMVKGLKFNWWWNVRYGKKIRTKIYRGESRLSIAQLAALRTTKCSPRIIENWDIAFSYGWRIKLGRENLLASDGLKCRVWLTLG